MGRGVGVGTTIGVVVIRGVGCTVAVGVGGCVGEILFCTGISTSFTTWVGRTSPSGPLGLTREKAAYVPEAMMTKQSSINPSNFLLLGCVRLLRSLSLSLDNDTTISYFCSMPD